VLERQNGPYTETRPFAAAMTWSPSRDASGCWNGHKTSIDETSSWITSLAFHATISAILGMNRIKSRKNSLNPQITPPSTIRFIAQRSTDPTLEIVSLGQGEWDMDQDRNVAERCRRIVAVLGLLVNRQYRPATPRVIRSQESDRSRSWHPLLSHRTVSQNRSRAEDPRL